MTIASNSPHDQRLLKTVRPAVWDTPTPVDRYDLVVVGAGSGGLVSAAIGVALGARVALIEKGLLGGDCLNYGCVPSKGILRASRSWADAQASHEDFHGPEVSGEGDFGAVMERMRKIRADISAVDGAERFRSLGVDIFFGQARFTGSDRVEVEGLELRFRRAILATGARPSLPPIDGLDQVDLLTNETLFNLTERPDELIVLGAGAIGTEISHAFARFGSRVTLIDLAELPIPREEPEASQVALRALEAAGVDFRGGVKVVSVRESEGRKVVVLDRDGAREEVSGDVLLVALGRTPNTELGLEAAEVQFGRSGVTTDDRLRTTNRRIYAVGDVTGRHQFTHVADAHARLAVRNAFFFGRSKVTDLVIPMSTYIHPEVARVGPTRAELEAQGEEVDTVRVDLDDVDRAILDGETEGFVMVHLKAGSDTILGGTVVASNAGDIISQLTQAMTLGIGLGKLGDLIFPYPTVAEALRKTADVWRRRKLTARTKTLFGWFFRIWRRLPGN